MPLRFPRVVTELTYAAPVAIAMFPPGLGAVSDDGLRRRVLVPGLIFAGRWFAIFSSRIAIRGGLGSMETIVLRRVEKSERACNAL